MDAAQLSLELATERALNLAKVKPGCEYMARIAIEQEARAHRETYPEIFDPGNAEQVGSFARAAQAKSPALFAIGQTRSASDQSAQERAAYLRKLR